MTFNSRNVGFVFDKNRIQGYKKDVGFRGDMLSLRRYAASKLRLVLLLRVEDGLA